MALTVRAVAVGLFGRPTDFYVNLMAWTVDAGGRQVATANEILDSYESVLKLSAEAGLGPPDAVAKSWNTTTLARTAVVVEDQRQAILSIVSATAQLAERSDDPAVQAALTEAREKYNAGDFTGARSAATGAITRPGSSGASGSSSATPPATSRRRKPPMPPAMARQHSTSRAVRTTRGTMPASAASSASRSSPASWQG